MFARFFHLCRKSHWRQLIRRSTWYEARLSLRRIHKDRRARWHLINLGFLILLPVFFLAYLVVLLKSGAIFLLPFAIPAVWWIRRNNKRSEPMHITPQPEPLKPAEVTQEQRERLCTFLGELGLFYAVMLDRAGSELVVQQKKLPPDIEIISRRTHIDLLRHTGIWDKILPADREAVMIADGHWDQPMIRRVSLAMEPYRLIRWLLRVDSYLPLVGRQSEGNFALAHEMVLVPEKLLRTREFVTTEDLDLALHGAREYFYRCLAESIHRGYRTLNNKEASQWAADVATRLSGRQHEDLTIGAKLVSEADADEIAWTITHSHTRMTFLNLITGFLNGARTLPLRFSLLKPEPEPAPAASS